jgi:hypothetical protein
MDVEALLKERSACYIKVLLPSLLNGTLQPDDVFLGKKIVYWISEWGAACDVKILQDNGILKNHVRRPRRKTKKNKVNPLHATRQRSLIFNR